MCACLVIQSYFTHCNPMDFSPLGSPFHGIFKARIVERFAFFFSKESSWPRDWTQVCCISSNGRWILYHWATWEANIFTVGVSNSAPWFLFEVNESISSVQFSCSVMSDSLQPYESQHARPPCSSTTPWVHPNSCASSRWCHLAISSSVIPFSSCSQSLPASGSFPTSQLFAWGGQSTGVSASASVLPNNTQTDLL